MASCDEYSVVYFLMFLNCGLSFILTEGNAVAHHCHVPFSEAQRIANSHLRKVSVSESNVLLDEEVLTDPKIQMLLLTVLVRNYAQIHFPLSSVFSAC